MKCDGGQEQSCSVSVRVCDKSNVGGWWVGKVKSVFMRGCVCSLHVIQYTVLCAYVMGSYTSVALLEWD